MTRNAAAARRIRLSATLLTIGCAVVITGCPTAIPSAEDRDTTIEALIAPTSTPIPTSTPMPTPTAILPMSPEEQREVILEFARLWLLAGAQDRIIGSTEDPVEVMDLAIVALEDYQRALEELPAPPQIPELAEIKSTIVGDAVLALAYIQEAKRAQQEGLPSPAPPIPSSYAEAWFVVPTMTQSFDISLEDMEAVLDELRATIEPRNEKSEEEAAVSAEWDLVQTAIDAYIADNGLASLPTSMHTYTYGAPYEQSTSDFSPTGRLDLTGYLRPTTTVYSYCWNANGLVVDQGVVAGVPVTC